MEDIYICNDCGKRHDFDDMKREYDFGYDQSSCSKCGDVMVDNLRGNNHCTVIKIMTCDTCKHYHNSYSSIFGDCFTCSKKSEVSNEMMDNVWDFVEENAVATICDHHEHGEPQTFVLG